ncbi:orotidine-5'-phosphate decarboxylase [Candidatus Parcubacteria bacterium]|nr:orotidine-5'-phosphate decarboxylase [Candidatus Parcubacteria bacterium]
MGERDFRRLVQSKWGEGKHLCVGLDPAQEEDDAAKMCNVVKETLHVAAAYKLNLAFYLAKLEAGVAMLRMIIKYIQRESTAPVILDCKFGDIGNTSGVFFSMVHQLGVDAVTVSPYLGREALDLFLMQQELGVFVLCRTSNPGADQFQDLVLNNPTRSIAKCIGGSEVKLFHQVAYAVKDDWNRWGNCGLVVGATRSEDLADVRRVAPEMPLLIPGVGAQGGDLGAAVRAAKYRFLVNVSRGISGTDKPRGAAEEYDHQIREHCA